MTMNLRIYHLERAALHSRCKSVFVTLGYQLIEEDPLNCILRAVREEPAGACSSLLDIRIKKEPEGIQVLVLSGQRSNVFGTIRFDPDGETEFIEHFLFAIQPSVIRHPEFRLTEADYAFASGF